MHGRTAGDTREREDDARELTDLLNEYGDTREREDDAVKAVFHRRFTSSQNDSNISVKEKLFM